MGRALFVPFWQDSQGDVVAGLSVDIIDPNTGARIADTVYADATSNSIVTLPVTTDTTGHGPPLWLAAGRIAKQRVTLNGVNYDDWALFVDPTATGGGGGGGIVGPHTHAEGDVTSLPTDLANKSPVGHTHVEAEVSGLLTDLSGKANTSHSHVESDVGNLLADLAGRSNVGHTHTVTRSKTVPIVAPSGTFPLIVPAWTIPTGVSVTVTAVQARRDGGSGATINARRVRSGTAANLLGADYSITADSTTTRAFASAGAPTNTAFTAADVLEVMFQSVTGSPTLVAIQVDYQETIT